MSIAASVIRMAIRVIGVVLITLGALFWSGNALRLVQVHMLLGVLLVLLLWTLAILGAIARVPAGYVALALVWGLIVPALGLTQTGLLPGSLHWIVQIVHLLVGLGAIGQAENLANRISGRSAKAARGPAVMVS